MPKKITVPDLDGYNRGNALDTNYWFTITVILSREISDQELDDLKKKCKDNAIYIKNINDLFIQLIGTSKSFGNIFGIKMFEYKKNNKNYYSNDMDDELDLDQEYDYIEDIVADS